MSFNSTGTACGPGHIIVLSTSFIFNTPVSFQKFISSILHPVFHTSLIFAIITSSSIGVLVVTLNY